MVKTTQFNGINLPDIGIISTPSREYKVIKSVGYNSYKNMLSRGSKKMKSWNAKHMIWWLWGINWLCFSCIAQQQPRSVPSHPKWGILDFHTYSFFFSLHDKPSGTNIKICVPKAGSAYEAQPYEDDNIYFHKYSAAIQRWAELIGKSHTYTKLVYDSSDNAPIACRQADIRIIARSALASRSETEILCSNFPLLGAAFVKLDTYPMRVVYCMHDPDNSLIALHEVGHLYGLCDIENGVLTDNCMDHTGTGRSDNGVMDKRISDNALARVPMGQLRFSPDDIAGIRAIKDLWPQRPTLEVLQPDCSPPGFDIPEWGYKWGDSVLSETYAPLRCSDAITPGQWLCGDNLPDKHYEGLYLKCDFHHNHPAWSCHSSLPLGQSCT